MVSGDHAGEAVSRHIGGQSLSGTVPISFSISFLGTGTLLYRSPPQSMRQYEDLPRLQHLGQVGPR